MFSLHGDPKMEASETTGTARFIVLRMPLRTGQGWTCREEVMLRTGWRWIRTFRIDSILQRGPGIEVNTAMAGESTCPKMPARPGSGCLNAIATFTTSL